MERNFVFRFNNLWKRHKFVHKLLSHHFFDDVFVVVVAQRSAELVVVHVELVFAQSPQFRHLLSVDELELSLRVGPLDDV